MMGGHFTLIGALVVTAIAYWAIRYGQGSATVGAGVGTSVGNLGRAFTANPATGSQGGGAGAAP